MQIAEKEEDQVDLELATIGACIKRKLTKDEIDDILDEIKDMAWYEAMQYMTDLENNNTYMKLKWG